MDFLEFTEQARLRVRQFLPESFRDAEVCIERAVKNNDQQLTALTVSSPGSRVTPRIYLEGYYEMLKDGMDLESVLKTLAKVYLQCELPESIDLSMLQDFSRVKHLIVGRLVNRDLNAEFLSDKPFTEFEDLAVYYAVRLDKSLSIVITNEMLERFRTTREELHALAMRNLEESEVRFMRLDTMLAKLAGPGFPPLPEDAPSMYVLTNEDMTYGAVILASARKLREIYEELGCRFMIIPSSVHELIVLPMDDEITTEYANEMVRSVNRECLEPAEVLSDHVYFYDEETGRVTV